MVNRGGQRGVALIFVLWLLVLLGVVIADVASRARSEAVMLSTLRSRTTARYAAESGILVATMRLEALLDSAPALPQRIPLLRELDGRLASLGDVELGTARFGVAVVDLNARIDVNRADAATLRGLFQQFTTERRAEAVVTALKEVPIRRLAELASLPGIDDSVALAVAPYVTVWSDGLVNINSAPEPVLAALPGVARATARRIVRRRETGELFMSTDPVRAPSRTEVFLATGVMPEPSGSPALGAAGVPGGLVSIFPTRLMLISRGWQQGHPLTHEIQAVYALVEARLVLQSWQERDR